MSFFGKTGIGRTELRAERRLKDAFEESRLRGLVSGYDRSLLSFRYRSALLAVNPHSRLLFARTLCEEISKRFCEPGTEEHDAKIHLVTLVDITCATSPELHANLDWIGRRLRIALKGLSYIGMVEPAYYVNLQAGTRFTGKRCIFWHLHAIVWGISQTELRQRVRQMEESGQYVAIAPGLKATHTKRIRHGTLPKVVGYILKSPSCAYRVTRRDREGSDGKVFVNSDGEVVAYFIQGKSELRKGDRIRLFLAMKDLYLDKLSVAGGEGTTLLARAKRVALSTRSPTQILREARSFRSRSSRHRKRRKI
jgi:hypothetical protein